MAFHFVYAYDLYTIEEVCKKVVQFTSDCSIFQFKKFLSHFNLSMHTISIQLMKFVRR